MALTGQHWQQPIRAKAGKGELNRALGGGIQPQGWEVSMAATEWTASAGYPSCSCNRIPKQCRSSDDCMVWLTNSDAQAGSIPAVSKQSEPPGGAAPSAALPPGGRNVRVSADRTIPPSWDNCQRHPGVWAWHSQGNWGRRKPWFGSGTTDWNWLQRGLIWPKRHYCPGSWSWAKNEARDWSWTHSEIWMAHRSWPPIPLGTSHRGRCLD